MVSLSKWIFGQQPKSTITTLPTMTSEQQAALKNLLAELGPKAELSGLEGLSLEALEQKILGQVTGGGDEAEKTIGEAETALSGMLASGGAPVDFEQYFQKAIRDPALQDFTELILPEITRRYGASGAFGSDRVTAEQRATQGLNKELVGARTGLEFQTRESALNRIMSSIGLAPGVAAFRPAIETQELQNILAGMEGAGLPRKIDAQRINQILAALGVKPYDNIPQTTPGQTGTLQSVLTAFAGNAGGGTFFRKR